MKISNNKIRIGVLGAANIAVRSIIPEIQNLSSNFDFIGIASRHPENSNLSKEFKMMAGYHTILDKEHTDAVYIPLPNALHYEWVKIALLKGLHVLVEKSLACTSAEVMELNKIAKENNLALVENFQFRFHSQLQVILQLLNEKTLGELRIVRSTFCFPPFSNKNNIRYKKELGGGALLDAGAYPVKLSQLILGTDIEVTSSILNYDENLGVDIWGGATLKQKDGPLFSQIAFGFDNYYQCNVEIIGSIGRLYTNRIFTASEAVTPKIILETISAGCQEIELKPDNHFKNMLLYFHSLAVGLNDKNKEYADNVNQARLLEELKIKSNER